MIGSVVIPLLFNTSSIFFLWFVVFTGSSNGCLDNSSKLEISSLPIASLLYAKQYSSFSSGIVFKSFGISVAPEIIKISNVCWCISSNNFSFSLLVILITIFGCSPINFLT